MSRRSAGVRASDLVIRESYDTAAGLRVIALVGSTNDENPIAVGLEWGAERAILSPTEAADLMVSICSLLNGNWSGRHDG